MIERPILSHPARGAPRDRRLRVLVAPNAFKGSLTSGEAAAAMAVGVASAMPGAIVRQVPIADGGDGSVDACVRAGFERRSVVTRGPTGALVTSSFALRGDVAIVEVASTCGLLLLPGGRLEPMASSTAGLGDAIVAALDAGAAEIVVCLGGSASTDGGAGMLSALGAVLRDDRGRRIAPSGSALHEIADLDLSGLDDRLTGTTVVVATDVTSPLLGPEGAAAVFGPQKGADPRMVAELESGLASWARLLGAATGRHVAGSVGAGAAGGAGAAALAVLDARWVPGALFIQDAVGLPSAIDWADLLVTGEGRLDGQSALGKGALSVVRLACDAGVPAVLVCGSVDLLADEIAALGVIGCATLTETAIDGADAMHRAAVLLEQATRDILRRLEP